MAAAVPQSRCLPARHLGVVVALRQQALPEKEEPHALIAYPLEPQKLSFFLIKIFLADDTGVE